VLGEQHWMGIKAGADAGLHMRIRSHHTRVEPLTTQKSEPN